MQTPLVMLPAAASAARDKGLEPLADGILSGAACSSVAQLARQHVRPPQVPSADAALAGARDIIAERAAELPEGREWARAHLQQQGVLVCKLARGAAGPAAGGPGEVGASKGSTQQGKWAKAGGTKAGGNAGGGSVDVDVFRMYHDFRGPTRTLRPHQARLSCPATAAVPP